MLILEILPILHENDGTCMACGCPAVLTERADGSDYVRHLEADHGSTCTTCPGPDPA